MTGTIIPLGRQPDKSAYGSKEQVSLNEISRLPTSKVPISRLRPGFFVRQSGIDAAHVQLLADAADSYKLPPILVHKGSLRIIDGSHRVEAAKLRDQAYINARLIECSHEEIFILALKSNTIHGLLLPRADRINGTERILAMRPDWSDRAVAAASGLSAKTVAGIRARLAGNVQGLGKRVGRDGKRQPVRDGDGRRRAADYFAAHPDTPLREVARKTDVSLGTAHDVRRRLRLGLDPVATKESRPTKPRADTGAAREDAGPVRDPGAARAKASALPHSVPDDSPALAAASASRSAMLKISRSVPGTSWQMISEKIANDPALRYSENGRQFLRWMNSCVVYTDDWKALIDAIPAHWLHVLSSAADTMAQEWLDFSRELSDRGKAQTELGA